MIGIDAGRIDGLTGVWIAHDGGPVRTTEPPRLVGPRKICAMGVKASRWVTMHGFALNVNTDLRYFNHIIPCGIDDKAVTSMQQELRRDVSLTGVSTRVREHLADLFGMELVESNKVPLA